MSDRVWVGSRKGLFRLDRAEAGRWTIGRHSFAGIPVSFVLAGTASTPTYAALKHGHFGAKLHASSDGGESWTECAVPVYPASGKTESPSLDLIWSLARGEASLWCGTIPGGLFESEDGAQTWRLVRTLWNHPTRAEWFGGGYDHPGIHSVTIDPRWPDHVMVAISCGGIWATTNGGVSWEPRTQGLWAAYVPPEQRDAPQIQDPHCLVRCVSAPEQLWVQHHNGVFRSSDEGRSWRQVDVPPSHFGFACAVHPHDPETAWFVPMISDEDRVPVDGKLTVSRTRDGGASFEQLRTGLPQADAYDLIYRHGLDISASGERLAIGSTTGGLWISEDQGDSWTLIKAHLPPIYCVRFA